MWEYHPDDLANNVKYVGVGMEQMESYGLRMESFITPSKKNVASAGPPAATAYWSM